MDRQGELNKIADFLGIDGQVKQKLLKIKDLSFLKLLTPLILLAHLNRRLVQSDDSIILITFYIASIEAIQKLKNRGRSISKTKLVYKFLKNNLRLEDKIKLLRSFTFSRKYKFKQGIGATYHLMRHGYIRSITNPYEFPDKFCMTGSRPECQCIVWLRENEAKVNRYINKLAHHLYKMRCAVLHDASGVLWIHDFESSENSSGSLRDAYSINDDYFVSYESGINRSEFYSIMKPAFEKFLMDF